MKVLCRDYQPCEDSKRCRHLAPGGICGRRWRFKCLEYIRRKPDTATVQELFSHPEAKDIPEALELPIPAGGWIKIPAALGKKALAPDGVLSKLLFRPVSWSQVGLIAKCPRAWWLQYIKRIRPIKTPHYFPVGRAAHSMIQALFQGDECWGDIVHDFTAEADNVSEEPERFLSRLYGIRGVIKAWAATAKLPKPGKVEIERHVSHPLLAIHGYVDAVVGRTGLEFKFASSLDITPAYKAQAALYMAMDAEIKKFRIMVFNKPSIRTYAKKPAEDWDDLTNRVAAAVEKAPSKWYAEETIEADAEEAMELQSEMSQEIDRIFDLRTRIDDLAAFPRHFAACQSLGMKCQFAGICETGRLDTANYRIADPLER